MATHSSILAWRIPWTEELGGLQFMGSQRAGHARATNFDFEATGAACGSAVVKMWKNKSSLRSLGKAEDRKLEIPSILVIMKDNTSTESRVRITRLDSEQDRNKLGKIDRC